MVPGISASGMAKLFAFNFNPILLRKKIPETETEHSDKIKHRFGQKYLHKITIRTSIAFSSVRAYVDGYESVVGIHYCQQNYGMKFLIIIKQRPRAIGTLDSDVFPVCILLYF